MKMFLKTERSCDVVRLYAAFTPYRNYRNSEMTTRDVQLGAVHVFGLGIIRFYNDSQQNEPA